MEKLLTVKEVAGITRLAQSSVYALVAQRAIPHIKLGARVVFNEAELTNWIEAKRQPQGLTPGDVTTP